jgi:hypothetical protein
MNDTEFIDFMKELILAPDSAIKKAHMERAISINDRLQKEANLNMQEICRLRGQIAKIRALIIKKAGKK